MRRYISLTAVICFNCGTITQYDADSLRSSTAETMLILRKLPDGGARNLITRVVSGCRLSSLAVS